MPAEQSVETIDFQPRIDAGAGDAKARFEALAAAWKHATRAHSSVTLKSTHPAYQQIIGMGKEALPFIFKRLQGGTEHWFWALTAITGEMPIPAHDRGNVKRMREHWLEWGRKHGFVGSAGR